MGLKRHLVMDLFYGKLSEEVDGDWNKVEKNVPEKNCKVKVKMADGSEFFAYFYEDGCQKFANYGMDISQFWNCTTKEPVHNVVEWKNLKD